LAPSECATPHRIWGYTSKQIAKAPLLGSGIASARALNDYEYPNVPRAPGTNFQLSTNVHSHNAYLQIWIEGGGERALFPICRLACSRRMRAGICGRATLSLRLLQRLRIAGGVELQHLGVVVAGILRHNGDFRQPGIGAAAERAIPRRLAPPQQLVL
jgi:hypothetical protein